MRKKTKTPLRQCLGCREHKPKKELCRVTKSPLGEISIDEGGKKPGRGAYICPAPECFKKARKSKVLERNFRLSVPGEVYDGLQAILDSNGGAKHE
ncbi:MAG: YlxR family protein [Oscillospiraceae bacterium]|nr:YlxR family protein [Oscillospiraceae bacterium]